MEVRFNHLRFLNANADYSSSPVVVLGCPFDGTSTYQPGSRFAPNAVREASLAIESYSPEQNKDLSCVNLCDLGDLELPFGNTSRVLDLINLAIDQVLNERKVTITLGGEHLISLPVITAFKKHHPDLVVVHLDAHADLREEYLGEKLSHSTVMRRVLEVTGDSNLIQIGIRSGTQEEFLLARSIGCQYSIHHGNNNRNTTGDDLRKIERKIQGKPLYISLDLDVLDPSVLPGTGTPEPGGFTFAQLMQVLSILRAGNVVGMDIVELLPYQTPHQVSSIVAAKIMRESILLYFSCP
ncbi:MAG: agmatinase [bacterium]